MSGGKNKVWKKYFLFSLILILCVSVIIAVLASIFLPDGKSYSEYTRASDLTNASKNKKETMRQAAVSRHDSNVRLIRVSREQDLYSPIGIDENAGRVRRVFTGRRINIALIGVDSRLNSNYKHADANHLISILIDKGKVEITSIPRDTPVQVNLKRDDDSTASELSSDIAAVDTTIDINKLTVLYAAKGRKAYLDTVAKIAEVDRIPYYIEVGFSQARGVLELLGYKNSGTALQVLRSRTAFDAGDYQRVYNQAQFIKQTLLKRFTTISGFFSGLIIRSSLTLLNTNLNYDAARFIIDKLKKAGFPRSEKDITIRIRPPMNYDFKIYNLSDKEAINSLAREIENKYKSRHSSSYSSTFTKQWESVADMLNHKLEGSEKDSSKPWRVVSRLKTLFNQRAWLQVENPNEREKIRDKFGDLLITAYERQGKERKAQRIRDVINMEKRVFSTPLFKESTESSSFKE